MIRRLEEAGHPSAKASKNTAGRRESPYGSRIRRNFQVAAKRLEDAVSEPPEGMSASMVTLTLPGFSGWRDEMRNSDFIYRALLAWWKRVLRKFGNECCAIWCLELQYRTGCEGLPPAWHLHLILFWPDAGSARGWKCRQRWLSNSWATVVAGGLNRIR